jgi:hypothetical protein
LLRLRGADFAVCAFASTRLLVGFLRAVCLAIPTSAFSGGSLTIRAFQGNPDPATHVAQP